MFIIKPKLEKVFLVLKEIASLTACAAQNLDDINQTCLTQRYGILVLYEDTRVF